MSESRTLIRDALLVSNTPEAQVPFVGWLLVSGNRVEALGRGEPPRQKTDQVIDGNHTAVIPGLVNAHGHSHSSLTRGSAEGVALEAWLKAVEVEQSRLTREQAYFAALATYAEMLLSGTTLVMDMCLFPEAAVQAAQEIGIRAVIAPYVADSKPFAPTLDRTEQLLAESPYGGGTVKIWCGLHDLESCSEAQIRTAIKLAARYGAGLHLHCAETRFSVEKTLKRTGQRPVTHLASLGALSPRTLLAHCVWIDESEQGLLRSTGAYVAHCPHANLKLGCGVAPVPELIEKGVGVALATDGAKANNRLDMFEVMKLASLIHKGTHCDPAVMPPERILAMATRDGAAALDVDAGTLAPGMLADLTLVRLDRFHLQPAVPETIVTNLVHAAHGSDVRWVMVNGKVVVANGIVQTIDQTRLRERVSEIGRSLLQYTNCQPPRHSTDHSCNRTLKS